VVFAFRWSWLHGKANPSLAPLIRLHKQCRKAKRDRKPGAVKRRVALAARNRRRLLLGIFYMAVLIVSG
jgi:hypothetical protein